LSTADTYNPQFFQQQYLVHISTYFNLCTHEENNGLHTMRSKCPAGMTVLVSERSITASRLPLRRYLWHNMLYCMVCFVVS